MDKDMLVQSWVELSTAYVVYAETLVQVALCETMLMEQELHCLERVDGIK
jgi:hypothetical protein